MRKCKLCGRRLDQDEGFCRCYMSDEALIPCTEELNRLKEFLADFKKQPKGYSAWAFWGSERYEKQNLNRPHCVECGDPIFGEATAVCDYCLDRKLDRA